MLFDRPGLINDARKLMRSALSSKGSIGSWVKANRPVLASIAKAVRQKAAT
jgi:hypothetical protein